VTRILAIGPHPDDIEFGCAPVLVKEAQRGSKVHMLICSRGEAATHGTPEGREREARDAAGLIGTEVEFLDFGGDCHMEDTPANAFLLASKIRELRPDVVLAPHPGENQHPDHPIVARLARNACRLARYGGVAELKGAAAHAVRGLYFYRITQLVGEVPDIVIDVSGVVETWQAAMRCHHSQVSNRNYVDLQLATARSLGASIGVDYAVGLWNNDPIRLDYLSDLTLSSRYF
jgi:LmbE family N-acetylglucosaminyl deacetylase